jgi:hypothetical protein
MLGVVESQVSRGARHSSGRRVLVAIVTGEIGRRIQEWRERHDPTQTCRIPPHATLCYRPGVVESARLGAQVRHAFDRPITVRLGAVREMGNADHTFYVEILDSSGLDEARERLHDATYVELPKMDWWPWHVTCVRYGRTRDLDQVRRLTSELVVDAPWQIDTVAYLELRDGIYHTLAEWRVGT